jgi:nitroimidazol reductase NimA-like FMN-containing flavoprotein (pyridoxamine 5'-phosphate oxidase superfamily)
MSDVQLPDVIKEFVERARVCRVATARPSGEPHLVALCHVFDGDRTVYVDIGRESVNFRILAANPQAALLVDEYDENWALLKGVLLRCDVEDATEAEQDRAWEMIRAKFPQHKDFDWTPRLVLALRIRSWTDWGITSPL